jgi:Protein of unknown function (DUF692)
MSLLFISIERRCVSNEVQEYVRRPYLLENPSSYVSFKTSTMSEVEFLRELVCQTGCRLLCDVSNVYLSAHNMGYDPYKYLDGLPAHAVGELHLGRMQILYCVDRTKGFVGSAKLRLLRRPRTKRRTGIARLRSTPRETDFAQREKRAIFSPQ